jgi:hypothetical protein
MGIPARLRAIETLAKLQGLPASLLRRVRSLVRKSHEIGDLRNRMVHDPWFIEAGNASVGQFKSMSYKDQRFGLVDVSRPEVDETLQRIRAVKTAAGDLYRECQALREASRRQRRFEQEQ